MGTAVVNFHIPRVRSRDIIEVRNTKTTDEARDCSNICGGHGWVGSRLE